MNMYLWYRAEKATCSYHDEGGIVVFAETLERARELISDETSFRISLKTDETKPSECGALKEPPDVIRENCPGSEYIYIFPDAGCC